MFLTSRERNTCEAHKDTSLSDVYCYFSIYGVLLLCVLGTNEQLLCFPWGMKNNLDCLKTLHRIMFL